MQAFDGVTVDLPVPRMTQLFDEAYAVLRQFNADSLRRLTPGSAVLEPVVERPARSAMERYPLACGQLDDLRRALLSSLGSGPRSAVWSHGDFKLENLVFDRSSRKVQAVIDWELAADTGLPMVDLLYLLAYREVTLGRCEDVLEVLELADPSAWSQLSTRYLDRYMAEFAITEREANESLALALLHHVGARYSYAPDDRVAMDRMSRIALHLRSRLAC
jgi:hypothetical protein